MTKHEEYLDEVSNENRHKYLVTDIHEELDNIERLVSGNESALLVLHWVRDAIHRVCENYET